MSTYICTMRHICDKFHISFRLVIDPTSDFVESCYNYMLQNTDISLDEVKEVYKLESLKIVGNCSGCENKAPEQFHHMECPSGCLHDPDFCLYCE